MKRHMAWTLTAALLLALLAGCMQRRTAPEPEQAEELIVVGYSQTGAESDWRVANTESITQEFTEENGYQLLFSNAQQKQENQIRAIRNFIQQQVDYIVFSPLTEDGWEPVLTEAREAGIPVIVIDRQVRVEDEQLYTAYVGSDFVREGHLTTSFLHRYLQNEGRGAEEISIVELQGSANSTAQLGRTAALEMAVADYDNWTLTAQLVGDFTTAKANEVVKEYLAENEPPTVLVCQNDNMALGAIAALEQAGCYCGSQPGQVMVLSFDATNAGLQACLAGKILYDAECNPLQGPLVRQVIEQLEQGLTPPKVSHVSEGGFDFLTITQAIIDKRTY